MAFDATDVDDDVLVSEGTFAYLFTAGEDILEGQTVCISGGNNTVKITTAGSEGIGVAAIDADSGKQISVYGPGNVVRLCVDASGTVGGPLYADLYGICDTTAASGERIMGYQLEKATGKTTNNFGKVLLI